MFYRDEDDEIERYEDLYVDWLCENCNCTPSDLSDLGECECPTFNEWFDNLRESAVEGMDNENYEEQYA